MNSHGISLVQSWIDNPTDNRGLIIENSSAIDGIDFDSSETGTKTNRPKLSILYDIENDCTPADRDNDGDVDGSDLEALASQGSSLPSDLTIFAVEFGRFDCFQRD